MTSEDAARIARATVDSWQDNPSLPLACYIAAALLAVRREAFAEAERELSQYECNAGLDCYNDAIAVLRRAAEEGSR